MHRPTLLLLSLVLSCAADAQIYRWTDANGQIHFGEKPPEQGQYERLRDLEATQGADGGGKNLQKFLSDRDAAATESQEQRQRSLRAEAERAERCAKARERIAYLEGKTARRLFTKEADGQVSRLTDEQFQQRVDAAHKAEADSCR